MDDYKNEVPDRYKIQNHDDWINVRGLSIYEFVENTYNGSDGYRDGRYIIPHPREPFYNERRLRSLYKNVFKRIIDAMLTPVFGQTIKRETGNVMFQAFIDNADNAGTSFGNIIQEAILNSRMNGISFVVVDNMTTADGETISDAVRDRSFPYAYVRHARHVKDYECDRWGNLISITFYDSVVKRNGYNVQQYRKWTNTEWQLLEAADGVQNQFKVVESGPVTIGQMPVIPVLNFVPSKNLTKLPDPPFYDLANMCFMLYNKESELNSLEMAQGFSILYTSGVEVKSLGHFNYINCGEEAAFPAGFASPDPTHHQNLTGSCKRLIDEIFTFAGQNGIKVAGKVIEESGISKEWDFRAEETLLKETATAAAALEVKVAELFGLYVNQTIDYEPGYPEHYSPTYTQDRVSDDLAAIDAMPPKPIKTALWDDFVENHWKNEPEKAEEIKLAIEEEPEPEPMPVPVMPPLDGDPLAGGDAE